MADQAVLTLNRCALGHAMVAGEGRLAGDAHDGAQIGQSSRGCASIPWRREQFMGQWKTA